MRRWRKSDFVESVGKNDVLHPFFAHGVPINTESGVKDKQILFIFQKLLLAITQKAREYRVALLLVVNEK